MIRLPDVAIVAIDNRHHDLTRLAIEQCLRHIEPAEVLILSDRDIGVAGARTVPIGEVRTNRDAERVMLKGVAPHLRHKHALYVQWDSWIVRPDMWDDAFLAHDWIGAPWSWHHDGMAVGNGGFSLRSKRLLDLMTDRDDLFPWREGDHEDQQVCRVYRRRLEAEFGISFASFDLAKTFSVEHGDWTAFGFHGLWNMPRFLDEDALVKRIDLMPGGFNIFRNDFALMHTACRARKFYRATQALRLLSERGA